MIIAVKVIGRCPTSTGQWMLEYQRKSIVVQGVVLVAHAQTLQPHTRMHARTDRQLRDMSHRDGTSPKEARLVPPTEVGHVP